MDPLEFRALGRYDPAAPGADDWRALLDMALVEVYALTR